MMTVSGNYQLGADFSCAGTNFVPIGTWSAQFVGSLNGNGFAIDGLNISPFACASETYCAALFGVVGENASITNVRLTHENIIVNITDGSAAYVGGIAAIIYTSDVTVSLSSVQGSIEVSGNSQDLFVGGLVGLSSSSVSTSSSNVSLSASTSSDEQYPAISAGGLVGVLDTASIYNSGAIGPVAASGPPSHEAIVGGLVGEISCTAGATNTCSISGSYATGSAADAAPGEQYEVEVGGLVGVIGGDSDSGDFAYIQQSSATGNVTAGPYAYAGGLVGIVDASATVEQSFATGGVTGGSNGTVGGLVGELGHGGLGGGPIDQSYSTGLVSDPNGTSVGGFVGQNSEGTITNSYWDLSASGIKNPHDGCGNEPDCVGVKGLTTTQMQDGKLDKVAGFDPAVWEPMKTAAVQPAPGTYYPQLWALSFPITVFPLAGVTPYTAPVATVFDHSPQTNPNSGLAALYSDYSPQYPPGVCSLKAGTCCDGVVQAFDGQVGTAVSGFRNEPTCQLAGYGQMGGAKFNFHALNYVGCGTEKNGCGGPLDLNYEGHPAFDYPTPIGTTVLAAVSGDLFYPIRAVGTGANNATYCVWHYMGEIPDAAPAYRIYYLHLLTHPAVKNQGPCAGVPGTSGTTGVNFTPPQGCVYTLNGSAPPYQFPLPQGTHVTAGCPVAESGDAGLSGPKAAHLHFEIQEIVPLAWYGTNVPTSIAYFPCWNENNQYNSKNPNLYCLPMDPYGWTGQASNCPTDPSQWQGDMWFCLTGIPGQQAGIPGRRFWAQ